MRSVILSNNNQLTKNRLQITSKQPNFDITTLNIQEQLNFLQCIDNNIPTALLLTLKSLNIENQILIDKNLYGSLFHRLHLLDLDQTQNLIQNLISTPPTSLHQVNIISSLVPHPLNDSLEIDRFIINSWLAPFPKNALNLISKLSDNYMLSETSFFNALKFAEDELPRNALESLTALHLLAYEGRGFSDFARIAQIAIQYLFSTSYLVITKTFHFITAFIFSFSDFTHEIENSIQNWNFIPTISATIEICSKNYEAATAFCECLKAVLEASEPEFCRFREIGKGILSNFESIFYANEDLNFSDLLNWFA